MKDRREKIIDIVIRDSLDKIKSIRYTIFMIYMHIHRQLWKQNTYIWLQKLFSSSLEVKNLDRKGKDESKKYGKPNNCNSYYTQEVMPEPKIPPDEALHRLIVVHEICIISELRGDQSIQGPSHRACPRIPSPPHRNPLQPSTEHIRNSVLQWKIQVPRSEEGLVKLTGRGIRKPAKIFHMA